MMERLDYNSELLPVLQRHRALPHVVLIDCGYSDWFECQDMRVVGPFVNWQAAVEWSDELQQRRVPNRDGGVIKIIPMVLADVVKPDEFEVA